MPLDEQEAIRSFWEARARAEYFPSAWSKRITLEDAYRIQLGLIALRCKEGERRIGWKVGLTAKPIQEQFGFHEPVFGCILDRTPSGHVFGRDALIKPGFEPELCARLAKPLPPEADAKTARASIGAWHPALEIIETRGDFIRDIELAIADNAQQKTIVLGDPVSVAPDLALEDVEARVQINGAIVATGGGAAVLGNPLNSVRWLAGKLRTFGHSLAEGDFIMTGSFTRQFPLAPGDSVRVDFSEIGSVAVVMSA